MERYPGSNSPSSFASEVVLIDEGLEKPYRIFMNNILKYEGYRFFQSSYDTDEKGTVLVGKQRFMGYFHHLFRLLSYDVWICFHLFVKNSRFTKLVKASAKLREERKKLFAVFVLGFMMTAANAQSSSNIQPLNSGHVSEFEELLLQQQ
jgi:hypothetical protein